MCETLVSLSGNALKKSLVANIKIGTSLKEIDLEFKDSVYDIYLNGYLSGIKYNNLEDIIITKDIHTIVFNKKEEIEETECINCGACLKVCPHNIYVKEHYFKKNKSSKCIGCGLCNYICPARLKLKEVVMSGDNEKEKD